MQLMTGEQAMRQIRDDLLTLTHLARSLKTTSLYRPHRAEESSQEHSALDELITTQQEDQVQRVTQRSKVMTTQ